MKASGILAITMVIVFGLQGCATTGIASTGAANSSWEEAGPTSATLTTPSANQPVVKADTKENFEAVVAAIHKQMQLGARWQYIDSSERATIDNSFADMGKLYDRFGSVAKMDQAAKVRLLADQSTVNAILTKKDGDRLICQSTIPVGSHLPIKTCKTYAQIQTDQRGAQEFLRERSATTQRKTGN